MMKKQIFLWVFLILTANLLHGARPGKQIALPDFTKGDSIPEGARHDWNLGATGARGWMYSDKMETTMARQIKVTKVEQDSPAAIALKVGDVILGVAGKKFSYDPRTEFGKALTVAESKSGKLSLIRWRSGSEKEVTLQLPVLGSYSKTAPYDCEKSLKILENGCQALSKRMMEPSYRPNPIIRSLNALALLASGNPEYLPLVKQEAAWASEYKTESMATWFYGYTIMLLAEYTIATGDDSFVNGLRRLSFEAAEGQSIVGSWGHKFAGSDGRLVGYGMMNAPGLPLTTALILATKAGVDAPEVREAIDRSTKLLRFYAGKGAVPYGDHHPWIQTHEDNGKCGMAAVLFSLNNEREVAEFYSKMSLASHGSERDTGHTGNFFNLLWSVPGVVQSGPQATGIWMKGFGSWYFDLARQHDGTFIHQGPPSSRHDSYRNWDCSGAYLLAYAQPLRKIHLTGKSAPRDHHLSESEARDLFEDGYGWTNKSRTQFYDGLSKKELLDRLASWSPVVRERAAMAIGRKKDPAIAGDLISLLRSNDLNTCLGACQAFTHCRSADSKLIPALKKHLKHKDLWLRVKAAEALAHQGKSAMSVLPELLQMLAKGPTKIDPRAMEQRYLSFAVFGKMLKNSLDGVDRDLLREAIVAGLKNEDGRARGAVGQVYRNLSYEEIRPILPAIHEAIAKPSPSGIMFASGVRLAGLELLARHRIQEGMPLCFEVLQLDKWGKKGRIASCLKALEKYGAAAKPMLPKLKEVEGSLLGHRERKNLQKEIEMVRQLIEKIEKSSGSVELRRIE